MTPRRASGRGGFSLIELLTAMVVIGILAAIALPNFRAAIVRADASKVASDMTVVRTAVFSTGRTTAAACRAALGGAGCRPISRR